MTVVPFRKSLSAPPVVCQPLTVAEEVNRGPQGADHFDLSGVLRLVDESRAGLPATGEDFAITYPASLERQLRALCKHIGLPRLPFTAQELDALVDYITFLDCGRADRLPHNSLWQQTALETAQVCCPEWAPALRYYVAHNFEALRALHRGDDAYAALINVARRSWSAEV